MTNETAQKLTKELQDHGITDFEFRRGGKHPQIIVRHNGESHVISYCSTPSDRRSPLNDLRDLRRALGLKRVISKTSRQKKKKTTVTSGKSNSCKIAQPHGSAVSTVKPDPWAALKPLRDSFRCEEGISQNRPERNRNGEARIRRQRTPIVWPPRVGFAS